MKNIILIDWLSFSSSDDSVDTILKLLGLDHIQKISWQKLNGVRGYKNRIHFGGININYTKVDNFGNEEGGVWVEMSGAGCRTFDTFSSVDWSVVFYELYHNDYVINRIDIAYDDYEGLLNLNTIAKSVRAQNYISPMKSWEVAESNKGITVYIGSMKSELMFRFYDKAAERNRQDEIDHWVRAEAQLRDQRAKAFLKLMIQGLHIGEVAGGIFKHYLRFVKPSITESNRSRWQTSSWWAKFIKGYEDISLWTPCDQEYNLYKCKCYVFGQAGGAIDALIELEGLDHFYQELQKTKPERNDKYQNMINIERNNRGEK